jgi:hypothetical protein
MAHLLISDDQELGVGFHEEYLEEFAKGFEILKLRIGKLKSYSNELDQMVSYNFLLKLLEKHGGAQASSARNQSFY